MKLKFLLPLMAAVSLFAPAGAQTIAPVSTYNYLLLLADSTAVQYIGSNSTQVFPVFNDSHVNAVFSNCHIYDFRKAFPSSRFPYMRQFWFVASDCAHLPQDLKNANATLFPYYIDAPKPTLCYTPNDFGPVTGGPMEYLDFVHARDAWNVTKGDSNIVIGITDNYADLNNPDLKTKMVPVIGSNFQVATSEPAHGTMVCGYAAGGTDNGVGFPAMGFKCKLDFTSNPYYYDDRMLDLSVAKGRKVINGSWYNDYDPNPDFSSHPDNQLLYNEIYENGTSTVFAAGNGNAGVGGPNSFLFPASYDNVISVSSVGWMNPYGGSNSFNQQYVHVHNVGDTASHNHNTRVDICAPALQLAGLTFDPNDTSKHFQYGDGWGTSFASPIVAGTIGLMLSEKSCLSPYQREYLLKQNANMDSIASRPENAPYLNKLGAGLLNAGKALQMVRDSFDCNDAATQTFVIQGVKLNTRCKPGYASNGVRPVLMPELANGTPPYTYRWMPMGQNTANLDYLNIANPTVIASGSNNLLRYLLTVYDNSPVQKVATKLIEIHLLADSTKWDLAMRDAYADAMEEPNAMMTVDPRDWNVWESPDIWNRQHNDSIMVHENPEYFNNDPNYLYVVIRNIGCKPSPSTSKYTLHWTLASTGEAWPYAWDGSDSMTNVSTGQHLVVGGNLFALQGGTAYVGGSLQPGDTMLKVMGWHPPKPQDYNPSLTGNTLAVCVLARVIDLPNQPGFYCPEITTVSKNVKCNNNIVTRNLIVTNLDTGNKAGHRHMIAFGNPENYTATYSLQLLTNRDIQLHYAGNMSQYMYVTLYLGDLFTVWQANGGKGNYASMNTTEKTVTYDPSTPLRLDGIRLPPGEKYYIYLDFTIRSNTSGRAPVRDQRIHVRQLASASDGDYVYGDVSFAMNISTDSRTGKARQTNSGIETTAALHHYEVFPNPANTEINIQLDGKDNATVDISVLDITGKMVMRKEGVSLFKGQPYRINTASLQNGIYMIQVHDKSGGAESFKITKAN